MTVTGKFLLPCVLFFVGRAVAGDLPGSSQHEELLCNEGEDIYFSCQLKNKKIVSICAMDNTAPDRGYVKYKYGDKRNLFVYPRMDVAPLDKFSISDISEGTIRGLHFKFVNDDYVYVISSVWPGELYISKSGKIIFDQECQSSRYKSFPNKIFDGIRQVPPSGFDIH